MSQQQQDKKVLNLSVKPFLTAVFILLGLMVAAYILTFVLPGGSFDRVLVDGRETIVADSYHAVEGGIPFWRWILSPFLVLGSSDSGTILAVAMLLIVIGGAFNALDEYGVLRYALGSVYNRFKNRKYTLLCVATLGFMALGSLAGSFEEVIPLVPICVALAYTLGWDSMVGMGMSLLAVGCGFATGVCNVYTVGVAQQLAGLPMFSGIWMRLLSFVIIYAILILLLRRYAKKIEADPTKSPVYDPDIALHWKSVNAQFQKDERMGRAVKWFGGLLGLSVVTIIALTFIEPLQGIIMPVVVLEFFLAGTVTVLVAGMKGREFGKAFLKGALNILPGVGLILMAGAVKFTLSEANILDTILQGITNLTSGASPFVVVLVIYLLVLIMNLFISSGSAKAFLLMPLIVPLAQMNGIPRQMAVLAFIYGDGFSNVFYPTNAALLISLSLVGVSYGKWARWSLKYQIAILTVTVALLMFAMAVGYGGANP